MAPSTTLGSKEKHKANITTVMQNLPISPARNPLTIFWAFLAPRCLNACAAKKAFDPLLTPPPSNTEKAVEALIRTKETTAIKVAADNLGNNYFMDRRGFQVCHDHDGQTRVMSESLPRPRFFPHETFLATVVTKSTRIIGTLLGYRNTASESF